MKLARMRWRSVRLFMPETFSTVSTRLFGRRPAPVLVYYGMLSSSAIIAKAAPASHEK